MWKYYIALECKTGRRLTRPLSAGRVPSLLHPHNRAHFPRLGGLRQPNERFWLRCLLPALLAPPRGGLSILPRVADTKVADALS